jgi:AraC-like DNA-binding protein
MTQTREPDFFSKQVAQAQRFYIEGAAAQNSPIKLICGGCEQTRPDFRIDRKDFPYYSIEFVARGQGLAVLSGKPFILKPGTIFSYGPRISQVITSDPETTMTKYFMDFAGSAAQTMLTKFVTPPGSAIIVSRPDEMSHILDDLVRHGSSHSPYRAKICSTLLEYLFYRIAETKINEQINPSKALQTYQACRQYIRDNFIKLASLDDVAINCNLDTAYLCRLFKRFDTQSPYQYLLSLKMAFAARHIQSGTLVKEIAFELGFADPFHFSRVFNRIFGISPQKFKKIRSLNSLSPPKENKNIIS